MEKMFVKKFVFMVRRSKMKNLVFILISIFFISCTTVKADPQIDEILTGLADKKEIFYVLEKLNDAAVKENSGKLREIIDPNSKSSFSSKKEVEAFILKILKRTDYPALFQMLDVYTFNDGFSKTKTLKIYEINKITEDGTLSMVLNKRTENVYSITIKKVSENNGFKVLEGVSFELRKKGTKYKIYSVGLFSS